MRFWQIPLVFCGNSSVRKLTYDDTMNITIRFRTDNSVSAKGFSLSWDYAGENVLILKDLFLFKKCNWISIFCRVVCTSHCRSQL